MPATTNFQVFNPSANFQDDDSTYTADTLRTGGIPTAAIIPHGLANKLFYQATMFPAAFCEMLRQKGYTTSDANFANLVAALANVKTAAEFLTAITTIPYATSVAFDAGVSAQFYLTLTGNVSASSLVNTADGQLLLFIVKQDATGGRTLVWPASGTVLTNPGVICSLPNSISLQLFVVLPSSSSVIPVTPMLWVTSSGIVASDQFSAFSVNSNGTVASGFKEVLEKVDASGGTVTRTLYTATSAMAGRKVNVKKMDATQNTVLVAGGGGQTIDGQPNFPLSRQFDAITVEFDGSNWNLV